jgi:hypothetical protein
MELALTRSDNGEAAMLELHAEGIVTSAMLSRADARQLLGALLDFVAGELPDVATDGSGQQLGLPSGNGFPDRPPPPEVATAEWITQGRGHDAMLQYGPHGWADQFDWHTSQIGLGQRVHFGELTRDELETLVKVMDETCNVGSAVLGKTVHSNLRGEMRRARKLAATLAR